MSILPKCFEKLPTWDSSFLLRIASIFCKNNNRKSDFIDTQIRIVHIILLALSGILTIIQTDIGTFIQFPSNFSKPIFCFQVVILILGCFTICWLPYFIVACSKMFQFAANSPLVYYKAAFSLAMANSGMNPVIYAWKNRTFRRAFIHLLRCRTPDSHALIDDENARQNMKRKSSSLAPSLSAPPPTPNSIISATPPPVSITDTHHRSSLHRYHHGFTTTAFPLPPPPPSPQTPDMDETVETIVIAPKCVFGKLGTN